MKLTGKCKEDFEKWFKDKYAGVHIMGMGYWGRFYSLPFSMQYGVYVDFFDIFGTTISVFEEMIDGRYFDFIISEANGNFHQNDVYYRTRQEAREQAIEKANKIYNKQ